MNDLPKAAERSALLSYSPHIDGLRAIAIISVVGNHIGLPGFSGGYVGVDIFFVISGFLIITQIVDDLRRGAFSFGDFWSRRALRILPPLLVVLVLSVALGSYISVTSSEFYMLGQEALYSAFMAVNFLLLVQQGYFDVAATTKPFLHLWSLAVEEQYYLIAPFALALAVPAYRRWPRTCWCLAGALFAASLVACIWLSVGNANLAFYLMPTRAWEFIAGGAAGCFVPHVRRLGPKAGNALGWLGLALLVAPICWYSPDANYPSYLATVPVIGASAVILAGLAYPTSRSAKATALRPLVWIGLVSYAWYLWHWPLIAFARQYKFGELPLWLGLAAAAMSLALAWLTHLWVEVPIKNWRRRSRPKLSWRTASAATLAMCLVGLSLTGVAGHWATTVPGDSLVTMTGPCRIEAMSNPSDCLATAKGQTFGILMGDSHAIAATPAIRRLAAERNTGLVTLAEPGCIPAVTVAAFDGPLQSAECRDGAQRAVSILSSGALPVRYAILLARWQIYGGDGSTIDNLPRRKVAALGETNPPDDQRQSFINGVKTTLAFLSSHGVQRILVVAPTPDYANSTFDCVTRAVRQREDIKARCSEPRALFESERSTAMSWLAAAVDGARNVRLADPINAFCDDRSCYPSERDNSLYADGNHLNSSGEDVLWRRLSSDLEWVMSDRLGP